MARYKEYGDTQAHNRLQNIYQRIMGICYLPTYRGYAKYGGRGIKVCEEWMSFRNFYNWAMSHGYEKGMTIDRVVESADYSPSNCILVNKREISQYKNRWQPLTYNGETKPLYVWAKQFGISRQVLYNRLSTGWSIKEALTKPLRSYSGKYRMTEEELWND